MHIKVLIAATMLAASATCGAQGYPARSITMIVPGPPGGATDTMARALAEDLGKRLGQPVIVDNKAGGAGIIAIQAVIRAPADGYTLLLSHSTPLISTPHLYASVPYDVRRDLAFISELCLGQTVLVVNNQVPAKTMREFLAWAAQNKGKVSYGSYGVGSMPHVLGAHLNRTRGLDMTHVAYKGEAPLAVDVMAGNVQWAIASMTSLGPHIRSGKLHALAVVGDHRVKGMPDVPTLAEAGTTDQELRPPAWLGLLARAGTPAPALAKIEAATRASIASDSMRQRLDALALEPVGNSGSDFRKDFDASEPVMARLIRDSGAKLD